MIDPARVEAAAGRFRAFFHELDGAFFEREDILRQIALALLCREHALITGPPGTAKSALATAVFGRILCEESRTPSLYSRQITESTVQTDLIGPIDFKNLMETGRTTHFTDEGMLGAVHAFLDEVFDGRDMLLRSALNVLQERELKEGTKVVRGRIECALMTSNRYIADVIENARETLLAFVDRIAFIGFVPRGFAHPENMRRVLERHVARARSSRLDALLTLQDLDVLQAEVESVVVSSAICEAVSELLALLDAELNQAARADPSFVPTRYLSTRTAVRCGQVLRAQCVYDRIFGARDRELQVLPKDLPALRLHVLLGGPQEDEIEALLAKESDPNERRQLEIVRTEREIFTRCLGLLPDIDVAPLSDLEPPPEVAELTGDEKEEPLAALARACRADDAPTLVAAIRELAERARSGEHAARARALIEEAVAALNGLAFGAALQAAAPDTDVLAAAGALVDLAATVDDDTVSMHGVAAWLRGQADALVRAAARYVGGAADADLVAAAHGSLDAKRIGRRLDALDELARLRRRLSSAALAPSDRDDRDAAWEAAVDAVEEDIAALWDATFCGAVEQLLSTRPDVPLSEILSAVGPELGWLDEASERLGSVRQTPSKVKERAIGLRLSELIGARMAGLDIADRPALLAEVDLSLALLATHKLDRAVAPERWLAWCAEAMVRTAAPVAQSSSSQSADGARDFDGYVALREREQRMPVAYTLSEIALRVAPEVSQSGARTAADMGRVAEFLARLPEALHARASSADLARIERAARYLEAWWEELAADGPSARERLELVVRSRFFQVLWDDMALARHALETRVVAQAFPGAAAAAEALRARIEDLEARTRRGAQALLRSRTDAAWAAAVGREPARG